MKGGVVTKLRLIVFLPTILVLWDDKGTLAGSVPQMHDNSQLLKFLVLDKPGGKKSLIEIEGKIERKESVQKQTDKDGGILTDKGGFCSYDKDCPKGEVCLCTPPPMCGQPIKNAQPPKEEEEPRDDCINCRVCQVCCNFGNGTKRCDFPRNCPHLGKENGIKVGDETVKATTQETLITPPYDSTTECCFRYGLGRGMVPVGLKIISCDEYFEILEKGGPAPGGVIGKHNSCPKNAVHAQQIANEMDTPDQIMGREYASSCSQLKNDGNCGKEWIRDGYTILASTLCPVSCKGF